MRNNIRCSVLAVLCSIGIYSQTAPSMYEGTMAKPNGGPHAALSAGEFRLLTIKHLMQQPSPLAVGNAQLHRLGDQAAADIIKVIGGGRLADAQMPTVIDMLHKAYERPAAILNPSDRKPTASLFLLNVLESTTQSDSIKARIGDLRQFLQTAGEIK
ncbi:MAG: hypothetical protein J0H49_35360 [Acidobacteria bacterium]|nr:hypothetical protein [Acidobacteriota bacterium]